MSASSSRAVPGGLVVLLTKKALNLLDKATEQYLRFVFKPAVVRLHDQIFSNIMDTALQSILKNNKTRIPNWFTANCITYARTSLVIPLLMLISWGHSILPSLIIILVDFGDILDGIVARFWVDVKKEQEEEKEAATQLPSSPSSGSISSKDKGSSSDDESFEVVSTGSPHSMTSWSVNHRNRNYGGFIDDICDKVVMIPCWIALLSTIPLRSGMLHWLQFLILTCLVVVECASGVLEFRDYYTAGISAPKVEGFEFDKHPIKSAAVKRIKQRIEMVGTAWFILPWVRYGGLFLLLLSLPLAFDLFRRKVQPRVLYVNGGSNAGNKFSYKTLKYWMQAKAMGSKLIVGIPQQNTEMILNACACSSVDEVIAEAPAKVDLMFLEKRGIDYIIAFSGETQFVTNEVLNANRCLVIGDDHVARPWKVKEETKED